MRQKEKKVIIDIDNEGNCSIEGEGFVGPECETFMGEIEQALGKAENVSHKPEYRQSRAVTQRDTIRRGR